MAKRVLALGLDAKFVDPEQLQGFSPELMQSYIDTQLERVRALGYELRSCLVDTGTTAEQVVTAELDSGKFDCVLIGAGLRDESQLLLFEKLLNLVHDLAPGAKICFNSNPDDSAEAVQRWV
jgi:hypothetical protein